MGGEARPVPRKSREAPIRSESVDRPGAAEKLIRRNPDGRGRPGSTVGGNGYADV